MVLHALRPDSRTHWRTGLVVLAVSVYAAMWLGWKMGWTWVTTPDSAVLDVFHRVGIEHHGWETAWSLLCTVFSPVTFRLLTLLLIAFALVQRRWSTALFLLVSVEGATVVTEVAKRLADRPRPATALVHAPSTSFPSGHALGDMVAVLALAVVLVPYLSPSVRSWAVAAGVGVALLVGIGRVALNVHHPSDVVAGWALGYLCFVACLPILGLRVTATERTPVTPGTAP